MDRQRVFASVLAPEARDEVLACEDPSGVSGQVQEKVELTGCKRYLDGIDPLLHGQRHQ